MHKDQIEWFKSKLGVSDYSIAWIAFIKGLIFWLLLNHFLQLIVKNEKYFFILLSIFLISCSQGQLKQTQALIFNVTLDESLTS